MKLRLALLVALLCSLPLQGDITSLVQVAGEPPAGCNEFVVDFTRPNLSRWDVHSGYSLDGSNDELDFTGSGSEPRVAIYQFAATTDQDHFVKATMVDADSSYGTSLILRDPGECTNGPQVYNIYEYDGDIWISRATGVSDCGYTWSCDIDSFSANLSDNDVLAASVSGTGSGTEIKVWVNPDAGNCPADWGAADNTTNGCGGCCVDSDYRYVGVAVWPNGTQSYTLDDFVGGDN